jgi:hypothetical protein
LLPLLVRETPQQLQRKEASCIWRARMAEGNAVIQWLLTGDAAIRWQTLRDLVGASEDVVKREQQRVATAGWGARLLRLQEPSGQWSAGLYTPKWTSTTYTMVLLRSLGLPPQHPQALKACTLMLDKGLYRDGGINYARSYKQSETCITGMVLAVVAHFQLPDPRVHSLVGYLLEQQMQDGGWNCQSYRGATHSSVHTSILVLEGLLDYARFQPRDPSRVNAAEARGQEFLLVHRLFRSHLTGKVIHPAWTRFSFPPRWHYDILRALDYFRDADAGRDNRLGEAIEIVKQRRQADGRWILQNRYPGRTFFEMEKPGQPSRWNTLRALRVLRWWERG